MQVITDGAGSVPATTRTALTIGAYDGIHVGHQTVFATLRRIAARDGLATAVVTFDVHPAHVLRPGHGPLLLTSNAQRLELFADAGIDVVYLIGFTPERALTDAEDFTKEILVDALHAAAVIVGEDFHFGHDRSGDVDTLTRLGQQYGFTVEGLGLVGATESDAPVSSTAIRAALADGDVSAAATMLGRPYAIEGTVVEGDRRGRTIGFPTANIPTSAPTAVPADGVYAGWVTPADGVKRMAAINIGKRPTFVDNADESVIEAHLLDFDGDLYGQEVTVEFVRRLRSEQRFDGVDALIAQLGTDVETTRAVLDARG